MSYSVSERELFEIDLKASEAAEARILEIGMDPNDTQAIEHFKGRFNFELIEWHVAILGASGWLGGESQAGVDTSAHDPEFN